MNIRPATVSISFFRYTYVLADSFCTKVDDLMGMQACNLHNLPENYTMKYCPYILLDNIHPTS